MPFSCEAVLFKATMCDLDVQEVKPEPLLDGSQLGGQSVG